ncbi:MAG: hypothetical protein KAS72_14510 [Phycisphaerales bacterium]|nr:hypothetical protein [Phycisphaerales bacterium]
MSEVLSVIVVLLVIVGTFTVILAPLVLGAWCIHRYLKYEERKQRSDPP